MNSFSLHKNMATYVTLCKFLHAQINLDNNFTFLKRKKINFKLSYLHGINSKALNFIVY